MQEIFLDDIVPLLKEIGTQDADSTVPESHVAGCGTAGSNRLTHHSVLM